MRHSNFYGFFIPAMIPTRKAAISAVIAGVVASSMCAFTAGVAGAVSLARLGLASQETESLLAITFVFLIITGGIWRHLLSAAAVGLILGVGGVAWGLWNNQIVAVILLVVPIIGGFATSIRGILFLKRLER